MSASAFDEGHSGEVRLARIRNTEVLEQFEVSDAFMSEVKANPCLEILSGPHTIDLSGPLPVERS